MIRIPIAPPPRFGGCAVALCRALTLALALGCIRIHRRAARRQLKQVSDEGGGIKREQMGRVFAFLYTTARDNSNSFDDVEDFGTQSPMAGLGYGLPVARLYAR